MSGLLGSSQREFLEVIVCRKGLGGGTRVSFWCCRLEEGTVVLAMIRP